MKKTAPVNRYKKINQLCKKCRFDCKQNELTHLLSCPRFEAKPKQMEFHFKLGTPDVGAYQPPEDQQMPEAVAPDEATTDLLDAFTPAVEEDADDFFAMLGVDK